LGNFEPPAIFTGLGTIRLSFIQIIANHLNNKKFGRFEEVNGAILAYFESKRRSFYKAGIEKLVTRWEKVMASNGNYIID
jgi:hypothetical protein